MISTKKIIIKKIIFVFIVISVSIPLLQQVITFAHVKPLKGAVEKHDQPAFNIQNWFNGIFQSNEEKFINNNFGFRSSFVRLHNQLDYWLFSKVNANNVIIGQDGYLYELSYINEYLGRKFVGKKSINKSISDLKILSDSLAARDIDIVVLLAAGKASFFPEYFPDSLATISKTISNYDYFSYALDSANILNIDFNRWFVNMKDTSQYALFTKGGIHWSKYGEYLVADSIIKYVENLKGVKLPKLKLEKIETSFLPRNRDNDIGEGMNLIFPHSTYKMAYPKIKFDKSNINNHTKAMFVADSYYWELFNEGLSRDVFNNGQFWYYNKKIYSAQTGWYGKLINEIDIRAEVEKNDVVFILQTEATLDRFGFGFIEKQIEIYGQQNYKPQVDTIVSSKITAMMEHIKSDEGWYEMIKEKAKKNGISTEKMLRLDAEYVIEEQNKKQN